jgi:hypothetical protein
MIGVQRLANSAQQAKLTFRKMANNGFNCPRAIR